MRDRASDRLAAVTAWAAIGLGLAFRLRTAALPAETLTSRYLADDYFYYLNVAWNLAGGHGSSFDGGLTTTNGYQPLFMWLLAALFSIGLSKAAALHAGLAIQAGAAAAAAVAGYRIAAAQWTPWAGAAAAAVLSLNLFFILPTLTGFEMALALAAILAAAWSWQRRAPALVTGLLCGVAVLARVDSAALPAALALILISRATGEAARSAARDAAALTAGVLAVAGPWLLWNWIAFGSPMPDSGVIKAHYRGLADAAQASGAAALALPRILIPGRLVDWLSGTAMWTLWPIAAALAIAAWRGAAAPVLRALGIAAALLLIAYVFLIGAGEPGALVRYLYPVWAIAVILIAGFTGRAACVALLLAHAADAAIYVGWERTAPLQLTYVGAAHTLAAAAIDRLPPHDRVASFDAGALGYFASRPVVNLDGLANHDIVELRRHCRGSYPDCLKTYLRSKGITILAGGTGFGWTGHFPDWRSWERVYESPPLADGSRLVILRVP